MSQSHKSLHESEIVTTRPFGRRSALLKLGVAVVVSLPGIVRAEATDSDARDPSGRGRTGHTDRDSGPGYDGVGRGVCRERSVSDHDESDALGQGRGPCRTPSSR